MLSVLWGVKRNLFKLLPRVSVGISLRWRGLVTFLLFCGLVLFLIMSQLGCLAVSASKSHASLAWATSLCGASTEQVLVGGKVTAEDLARHLGMATASANVHTFPLPPTPLPKHEILRQLKLRIEGGLLVEDYAVVELLVVRVSGGSSWSSDVFGASLGGALSVGKFRVPVAGVSYPLTQSLSYFEGQTSTETGNTVNTTRKTVKAGTEFYVYWSRIDNATMRLQGYVTISSRIGDGLDVQTTELPFDATCLVGRPVVICEIVISSAEMAADLRKLTGEVVFAGDTVRLSICLR